MKKDILRMVLTVVCAVLFMNAYGQDLVIIIRHGEKPKDGDNLSCKAVNRSIALPKVLNGKFGVPYYIYVPKITTGKATKHARMFQTVVPYAIQHNLEINSGYEKTDSIGVAAEVVGKLNKHKHGPILMVWEHKNIMPVTRALGIPASQVPNWDDNDFDSIWIITDAGKPSAKLTIAHEGLDGVSDTCP